MANENKLLSYSQLIVKDLHKAYVLPYQRSNFLLQRIQDL